MVKRVICCSLIIVLLACFSLPAFAYDVVTTDGNYYGFSYDNSKIYMFSTVLSGQKLDVDNQIIDCNKIYFYIPCFEAVENLDFFFTICTTAGSFVEDSCDYGQIYSNSYHIIGSLPVSYYSWVGSSPITGSNASMVTCSRRFSNLPFNSYLGSRFIRYCIKVDSNYSTSIKLVSFLQKNLTQNLSGVLGNPTYSFSGTEGNTTGQMTSGSLSCSGYYITGSLKSMYYNGSSTNTFTGSLLNGTTGTGGYLHVPAHNLTSNASNPLKFSITGGNISGTLNPSAVSQNTDLQGTYLDRNFIDTVSMNVSRNYDDSEMIQAVNNASDRNHTDITNFSNRNHTDLVNIGNDLQELVDHQEQVNQAGNDIGSTTTSSSISNTSGNLSSGVSGLNSTLSTASDVSSFVSASTPYISFIGAFLPVVLNFGNGVLAWAVVAIIAVTVFLYILKKVSE